MLLFRDTFIDLLLMNRYFLCEINEIFLIIQNVRKSK